jgi:hypothetical protein
VNVIPSDICTLVKTYTGFLQKIHHLCLTSDDLLCTWTTLPPTWLLPMLGQPSFMQWSVVFQRTHVFQDTNCSTGTPMYLLL